MKKVISHAAIILVTAFTVFLVSTLYYQPSANADTPAQTENVRVEQVVVTQEDAQIQAIDKVSDAVVGVVNMAQGNAQGEGSGVVYKAENGNTYIVTNEHVVNGGDYFDVVFADGERYEGKLVGSDVYTDLAVLKVDGYEAPTVAQFGSSEDLKIGQTVIAIGNPLGLDFAGSATSGIVSGQDRNVAVQIGGTENWEMTVLQTDTSINPGNSGGALINLNGEVVGINSMKIASSSVEGMSFSIPTYVALPIISDLESYGKVVRPILGVGINDVNTFPEFFKQELGIPTDLTAGIYVSTITEGSLAESMGLQAQDVITAIGDKEVGEAASFRKELFTYKEGDQLSIKVLRKGEELTLTGVVTIEK